MNCRFDNRNHSLQALSFQGSASTDYSSEHLTVARRSTMHTVAYRAVWDCADTPATALQMHRMTWKWNFILIIS